MYNTHVYMSIVHIYTVHTHMYRTYFLVTGPCYYAGSAQGGRTSEREENESVIEGRYTDYKVNGLFDENFVYSRFENERCIEAV